MRTKVQQFLTFNTVEKPLAEFDFVQSNELANLSHLQQLLQMYAWLIKVYKQNIAAKRTRETTSQVISPDMQGYELSTKLSNICFNFSEDKSVNGQENFHHFFNQFNEKNQILFVKENQIVQGIFATENIKPMLFAEFKKRFKLTLNCELRAEVLIKLKNEFKDMLQENTNTVTILQLFEALLNQLPISSMSDLLEIVTPHRWLDKDMNFSADYVELPTNCCSCLPCCGSKEVEGSQLLSFDSNSIKGTLATMLTVCAGELVVRHAEHYWHALKARVYAADDQVAVSSSWISCLYCCGLFGSAGDVDDSAVSQHLLAGSSQAPSQ